MLRSKFNVGGRSFGLVGVLGIFAPPVFAGGGGGNGPSGPPFFNIAAVESFDDDAILGTPDGGRESYAAVY
jgi:hypothetical protein